MNYGQATQELKNGKMLQRTGWNDKGMFIFMQVPSVINKEIVPKMQSLPQAVKDEFAKRFNDPTYHIDAIYYSDQIAMVSQSNLITGWSPSVTDTLSDDWQVLD